MELTNQIIQQFLSGSEDAFNVIFQTYYSGLCNLSLKIVKDKESAGEIVQDLFVTLWENRKKLKITISIKAYLYRSVFNNSVRFVKGQKKFINNESLKNIEEEFDPDGNDLIELAELENKVFQAIEQLPPQCKEVFKLSREEGFKYSQIAEKLSISIKTVEAHITKALKYLHENLDF